MPMDIALGIRAQLPELIGIFTPSFKDPQSWVTFLHRNLPGNPPSVMTRLDQGGWTAETFQVLYMACWLHCPLEKGSFMLSLEPYQLVNVENGFDQLSKRWSSHLSVKGNGSKAGSGANDSWGFLGGYDELLVQIEERDSGRPQLFLKAEGHRAGGSLSEQISHLKSYRTKSKTGQGNTANQHLHELAMTGAFGIRPRAAENFSKSYEKLLKSLGFSGTLTTVDEAMGALWAKCVKKADKLRVLPRVADIGRSHGLRTREGREQFIGLNKGELAQIITDVLIPVVQMVDVVYDLEGGGKGKFRDTAIAAVPDLKSLADSLMRDSRNPDLSNGPRYFEEIRVTPRDIEESLQEFYFYLTNG